MKGAVRNKQTKLGLHTGGAPWEGRSIKAVSDGNGREFDSTIAFSGDTAVCMRSVCRSGALL